MATRTVLLMAIASIYCLCNSITTATAEEEVSKNALCDNYERTLLMLKPDAVQRGLIGELITRFERRGLQLVAMKFVLANQAVAEDHYDDHKNKTIFPSLIKYMTSGPVVPMVWQGCDAIFLTRLMIGGHPQRVSSSRHLGFSLQANMKFALPGTVRGDYATRVDKNVIHASDSVPAAEREIKIWFLEEEIVNWRSIIYDWI
ncbi:nucleoside diphosphate kinase-like protein [Leptotrombidium deliense]|uniref:Nucleoside diphosphate kinase n=1 Tax=Leptotrombidium deliense TaxID=299467 RepID=A0A443SVW4_9ACAR|nr:nucleoside diphosphate kinase-like protein [Leptotrombidium deliense]